ncbi:hypothetical protein [Candidatus Leptofilum sp.]|uniref:hypothetical protein n=1 Tax=Candidatus Leptofilum sp. TaxID=3241576 RepID=UPI003B5C22F6
MSLTQKQLAKMNEDQLRTSVLIPLFEAMGFSDVNHYHGGTLEQGKDILMWKPGDIGERVNYAVVVKRTKISGQAKGNSSAAEVRFQIEQCFGKSYLDPVTAQEQRVNRCFVVSSQEITKEALHALEGILENANQKNVTTFINGDKLWELIERHLPQRAVWEKLRQVQQVFKEASHDYRFSIKTTEIGSEILIEPKRPESIKKHPISLLGKPVFPDNPEGRKKREEFDHHLKTGSPVTLTKEYIEDIDIPDFLIPFLDPTGEGIEKVSFGSQNSSRYLLVKVIADNHGEETAVFEYIHLKELHSGTHEITFSNNDQPVPWKISLAFNSEKNQFMLHYEASLHGTTPKRALEAIHFQQVLANGCTLTIEHLDTGFELQKQKISAGSTKEPDPFWVDLVEKLAFIQNKTRVPIIIPDDHLTDEDFKAIHIIFEGLKTGRLLVSMKAYMIELSDRGIAEKVLESFGKGESMPVNLSGIEISEMLFGIPIPLGVANIELEDVYIADEHLGILRETLKNQEEENIRIVFSLSEGSNIKAEFLNWLPS